MRFALRFLTLTSRPFSRQFATKASRFQLAVTAGFAIAAIGFLTTVAADREGYAEGFLESLFGGQMFGQSSPFAEASRPIPVPYRQSDRRHAARRHDDARHAESRHAGGTRWRDRVAGRDTRGRVTSASVVGSDAPGIRASSATLSVCVRLCDGFSFPVGTYSGEADRAAHEATCHSQCPGAQTALFVLPSGSESITEAVDSRSGRAYSALPDAFHYTTLLDEACTCHPPEGNRLKSLLRDFTLRRGDAVMTEKGFRVFHGATQFPFRRRDFVALNRSPDIRKDVRPTFKAIERASLRVPSTIVAQRPAPSIDAATSEGTGRLEHQASR